MSPQKAAKRVLITGASRGIGQALVTKFRASGFEVAACARGQVEGAHWALKCDVGNLESVKSMAREVKSKWKRLDVLINNAGLAGTNRLELSASDEDSDLLWAEILNVNLNGTYWVTRQLLDLLPEGGRVINIASVLALKGVPDQTAYCAAKHGVLGFTRALAHAVARKGVTVNAICPGWTRTEMAASRARALKTTEKALAQSIPTGRITEPLEVAELAWTLTQAWSSNLTGQALTLDGGSLA